MAEVFGEIDVGDNMSLDDLRDIGGLLSSGRAGEERADTGKKQPVRKPREADVIFYGGAGLTEGEKRNLNRSAHEELYWEWMGKAPPKDVSSADLIGEMEATLGRRNIRLVVVCRDEKDPAGFFSRNMRDLDKYLTQSRKKLMSDAIEELKELGAIESEHGSVESKNKFKLCLALVKAQKLDDLQGTKFFDGDHTAALEELRRNPDLVPLFTSVEKVLSKDSADTARSDEEKLTYGDRGDQRSRDRSREGRGGL